MGTVTSRHYSELGRRLRAARVAHGLSREGLGHVLQGVHADTIGAWERGEWAPSAQNLAALARIFALDAAQLAEQLAAGARAAVAAPGVCSTGATDQRLQVAGLADVQAWGWTCDSLLEHLLQLDEEAFGGHLPLAIGGTAAHWAPLYAQVPECWRLIVSRPAYVVANWTVMPLRDEVYARVLEGRVLEADIRAEDLALSLVPGTYRAMVIDLAIRPGWTDIGTRVLLLRSFVDALAELTAHGMLLQELAANAHTPLGRALCRALQMHKVADHRRQAGSEVFVLPLRPPPPGSIFARATAA